MGDNFQMADLGELVAERFGLGSPKSPVARVAGGFLNRVWRLETEGGSFAVKELNLGRDWPCDFDAVFVLERAAFQAGVSMPEPVPDPLTGRPVAALKEARASVLVHRWVEGSRVPPEPVPEKLAFAVGLQLSRVHALNVPWPARVRYVPMPGRDVWGGLVARSNAAAMPWAGELAEAVEDLVQIGRMVHEWEDQGGEVRVSHRDVGWKNLLDQRGQAILLDWEASGPIPVAHELGHAGVGLASGAEIASLRAKVFRAFIAGYADGDGAVPPPGPHWLSTYFSNWTHFLLWNIERCVRGAGGVEPGSGPSLSTAHQVVSEGIRELRNAVRRLDAVTGVLIDAVVRG